VAKSNFREILENGKICAKHVSRPLIASGGSGVRTEMFYPLGVASAAAESNFRELLESGKIYAKHDKTTYKKVGVGLSNGNIYFIGGAYKAAEANSREILEIAHIVISDERTSDRAFHGL
jgi:hypothetical protein